MKHLLLASLLFFTACTEKPVELTPEQKSFQASETARYEAGPKYHSGCYKIVNKKHRYYGCAFQSTQGSMFLSDMSGQSPGYRDAQEKPFQDPATWKLVWNRKIRCLNDRAFFVDEKDVKPIKCPEYLYY